MITDFIINIYNKDSQKSESFENFEDLTNFVKEMIPNFPTKVSIDIFIKKDNEMHIKLPTEMTTFIIAGIIYEYNDELITDL